MRLRQETNKHYKRGKDFAHALTHNASQHIRGSLRYRRLRRDRQVQTWSKVIISIASVMLAILLAPMLVKTALGTRAEPVAITKPTFDARSSAAAQQTKAITDPLAKEVKDFLRRVHRKESSNGTNLNPNALHNICKARGESNEYGYGGMEMMLCFRSHAHATAIVAQWYREHRPQMESEAMTYCYYALGARHQTCEYWEEVKAW